MVSNRRDGECEKGIAMNGNGHQDDLIRHSLAGERVLAEQRRRRLVSVALAMVVVAGTSVGIVAINTDVSQQSAHGGRPAGASSVVRTRKPLDTAPPVNPELVKANMHATYATSTVDLTSVGASLRIGLPSIGRGTAAETPNLTRKEHVNGVTYAGDGISESFAPANSGVTQTLDLAARPPGTGNLDITAPITGLTARTEVNCPTSAPPPPPTTTTATARARYLEGTWPSKNSTAKCTTPDGNVDLIGASGQIRGIVSELKVLGANGAQIPSHLQASADGRGVTMVIDDQAAVYPIYVDPFWGEIQELTPTSGAAGEHFGRSVAISGSTAIVGAPNATVTGHSNQGEVFTYHLTSGVWVPKDSAEATGGPPGTSLATPWHFTAQQR